MKKFLLIFCCLILSQLSSLAFQSQNACNYLQEISGFSTRGYKSDGMGGYYCCSPYKMLDDRSNIAYYVEGLSNVKANKVYLVLNVYNSSNKIKMHNSLLSTSKFLAKKAIGINLNTKIISSITNGKSASFKQGKYIIEVKKQNWESGLGYEIHFSIKEL